MKILNIAAGKIKPLSISQSDPHFLLNVDLSYFKSTTEVEDVDQTIRNWTQTYFKEEYLNHDIQEFMERTTTLFDRVCIYRYLEHVTFTNVLYFIYLVSTVTKVGAEVDVIVPNYMTLAKMLIKEEIVGDFEAHNILLTTELLNEPNCPHASIWTPERAVYFWQLEKRFQIVHMNPEFLFDNRDIYLRFIAKRI